MRALLSQIAGVCLVGVAHAAEPPSSSASFDIRFNLADQREVHLAVTVPDMTAHRLQVDGDLSLELRISALASGGRWMEAAVVSTAGGASRRLAFSDWPVRPTDPVHVQWLSFSVCGDRIITLRDASPGRCADLLPMSKPDRLLGQCGTAGNMCLGPYEGMPATISAHERIAPIGEAGAPMRISGRTLDADGKPRSGVIVYAYQTDEDGVYPAVHPPRSNASNFHGRLRGWARSDARGRYTFDTIRPGSYGGNPEHVHLHVIEPGCATYVIDDLIFGDDPNYLRLTPEQRQSETAGKGGSGVTKLRPRGEGWEVTRDIQLGRDIPGYESCAPAR
jgi:protocatechuate 3,4-dioxygenase beta subunit